MVWFGVVWCGDCVIWCGVVWCGVVGCDMVYSKVTLIWYCICMQECNIWPSEILNRQHGYINIIILYSINIYQHTIFQNNIDISARFDGGGVGGLTPPPPALWCLSTPKFVLTPEKIVKISQKYIADPPLVSHELTCKKASLGKHVSCAHASMCKINVYKKNVAPRFSSISLQC